MIALCFWFNFRSTYIRLCMDIWLPPPLPFYPSFTCIVLMPRMYYIEWGVYMFAMNIFIFYLSFSYFVCRLKSTPQSLLVTRKSKNNQFQNAIGSACCLNVTEKAENNWIIDCVDECSDGQCGNACIEAEELIHSLTSVTYK